MWQTVLRATALVRRTLPQYTLVSSLWPVSRFHHKSSHCFQADNTNEPFRIVELPKRKSETAKRKPNIKVTFVREEDGVELTAYGRVGDTLLDVVVDNEVDLDGFGACEGTLSCSTCHLIFKQKDFDRIVEQPTDEEMDILDLAFDLTETSRLGCQVYLTEDLNGLVVRVPASVNDARST